MQIEVLTVYSIENILLNLGYKKEEILKNSDNDVWLEKIERKHALEKQSLVSPSQYYLFVEDSEKYHNEPNWKSYYESLKNSFINEENSNTL